MNMKGVQIASFSLSAEDVGGDFHDIISLSPNYLGIIIADVAGKGSQAFKFASYLKEIIHGLATSEMDINSLMKEINGRVFLKAKSGMFVTLVYGILDLSTRKFSCVNAGQVAPFVIEGSTILRMDASEPPLGSLRTIEFTKIEILLKPADVLILFTDGISEAINVDEEQFGEQRLINIVRENQSLPSIEIIHKINKEVQSFTNMQTLKDDATVIALKVVQ